MAFYATFLQDQFQVLCDLFIHIWNQARHCFKNGNLRSKCGNTRFANSTLITPPPMITRLFGTSLSLKSSSLVRTLEDPFPDRKNQWFWNQKPE